MKIEDLFVKELGYDEKTWKAQKTRITNKLGIPNRTEVSKNEIEMILDYIGNSQSKYRINAIEFKKKINDIVQENTDSVIASIEASDVFETMTKEFIEANNSKAESLYDDIKEKYLIFKRAIANGYSLESLLERSKNYRFEFDRIIGKLVVDIIVKEDDNNG